MKKKEYLALFIISTVLVILSAVCLFVVTTLDDVSNSYASTAKHSKSIINKIKSGEQPFTEEQVIKLFSNDVEESNSVTP